jgi:hypothetical protein
MQSFDKLTSDMARIYAIFKRAIGPQPLDEAGFSQEDGFVAIDTSNQYFSVRTDSNPEAECVITDDIDPKGYLRKAAGTTYVYTKENKVCYFKMCEDNTGGTT